MPAVWDADKSAYAMAGAVSDVTGTADATYGTNEVTLINDLKATVNTLLARLREAGVIES